MAQCEWHCELHCIALASIRICCVSVCICAWSFNVESEVNNLPSVCNTQTVAVAHMGDSWGS